MWDKKSTLALIEDIRRFPCLWDTQCEDYKRRAKKNEAYRVLGVKYNVNPKEIDLKFQALKNQFRREHRRLEKNEEGLSPKQIYWFGYEHLLFLLNNCVKPAPKTSGNVSCDDIDDAEAQDTQQNSDAEYTEYVEYEALESDSEKMTLPIKFKTVKNKGNATATEAFKCMRVLANKVCSRDGFDIYGEYIAHKLRDSGRSNREIAIAQHEINTICFKLSMGELAQNYEGSMQGSQSNQEIESEEVRLEFVESDDVRHEV